MLTILRGGNIWWCLAITMIQGQLDEVVIILLCGDRNEKHVCLSPRSLKHKFGISCDGSDFPYAT